jgi:hypothetical protein
VCIFRPLHVSCMIFLFSYTHRHLSLPPFLPPSLPPSFLRLLYQVTASVGLKHNSQVLLANAWHHRSDAISSVMALGGIVAARAGLAALDPVAGKLEGGREGEGGRGWCPFGGSPLSSQSHLPFTHHSSLPPSLPPSQASSSLP